jgi:hypothetical protein
MARQDAVFRGLWESDGAANADRSVWVRCWVNDHPGAKDTRAMEREHSPDLGQSRAHKRVRPRLETERQPGTLRLDVSPQANATQGRSQDSHKSSGSSLDCSRGPSQLQVDPTPPTSRGDRVRNGPPMREIPDAIRLARFSLGVRGEWNDSQAGGGMWNASSARKVVELADSR